MRNFEPVLHTHVANIALNKAIALPFLTSQAQETSGLTEYAKESYINDKLLVIMWLILKFTKFDGGVGKPWVELPEYEPPTSSFRTGENFGEYDGVLQTIEQEMKGITNLWDENNPNAVSFLRKLLVQIGECIYYTNQRLEMILTSLELSGPANQDNPEVLLLIKPKLLQQLMNNQLLMVGGYLIIKNEVNSKRIFTKKLLELVLGFVVEKAIQEGYAKP